MPAELLRLTQTAVDRLARDTPTPEDMQQVQEALRAIARDPYSGTPIPFPSAEKPSALVTWTADGKWRIVYKFDQPNGLYVLLVERRADR